MFKFNLTLLTIITFSYGITHPPRTTLQWNPNIFGNWKYLLTGDYYYFFFLFFARGQNLAANIF